MIYRNYTYSNMNRNYKTRWYCSKRQSGCMARVVTTEDGIFVEAFDDHSHPPPNLFRSSSGRVHLLKS